MSNVRARLSKNGPQNCSPKSRYQEQAEEWSYGASNSQYEEEVGDASEQDQIRYEAVAITDKKNTHTVILPFQLTKTFNQLQTSQEESLSIPRDAVPGLVPSHVSHYNTHAKQKSDVQVDRALVLDVNLVNVVNSSPFTIDVYPGKRTGIKGNTLTFASEKALFRIYPNTRPNTGSPRNVFRSTILDNADSKFVNAISDIADCNADMLSKEVRILGDGWGYVNADSRIAFIMKKRPDIFQLSQTGIQDTFRVDLNDVQRVVQHVTELQQKLDYADFANFNFVLRNATGGPIGDTIGTELEAAPRSSYHTIENKQYHIAFELEICYVFPRIDKSE